MVTQVILLGGNWFCTVFDVKDGQVTVGDTESGLQPHVRAWLTDNHFPKPSLILREREAGLLAEGCYIKPHMNDLYYSVDPLTKQLTPEDAANFHKDEITPEDF